jgi:integration host factor subunit beta
MSMTKADLVERVTETISETAGPMISKKDCARVVDAFLDAIKDALKEQKNIEVRGFGTFKIRNRKTRMARNPRTGEPVEVSARPVPVFKPSKELRALVAERDSGRERERGSALRAPPLSCSLWSIGVSFPAAAFCLRSLFAPLPPA